MIVLAIRTINSIVFKDVELVGTITYVGDMAKYPLEYENIAISEIKEVFLNLKREVSTRLILGLAQTV